jgi:hypothetical protein
MKIRIGQYSLTVKQLLVFVGLTLLTIECIATFGLLYFVAMLIMFSGLAMAVRTLALWFTWDGPFVGEPIRDSAISCGLLIISGILFMI